MRLPAGFLRIIPYGKAPRQYTEKRKRQEEGILFPLVGGRDCRLYAGRRRDRIGHPMIKECFMKAESVIIPEKLKILSGSALKCIALFTMIVDHVGLHLLRNSGIVLLPSESR